MKSLMLTLVLLININKSSHQMSQLKTQFSSLFKHASPTLQRSVDQLIQQSFAQLGEQTTLALKSQWMILSKLLDTPNKLNCLQDRTYRQLIIQFMNQDAVDKYRSSYFNHAKLSDEYLAYLKRIGAYEFIEVLKIVNKLKLIEKHYRQKMEMNTFSESHIEGKIRVLMGLCLSKKRSENNNLAKFKAIADFQDRIELIKELGKLLRQSWKNEKKNKKIEANIPQGAQITMQDEASSQTQMIELAPHEVDDYFTFF